MREREREKLQDRWFLTGGKHWETSPVKPLPEETRFHCTGKWIVPHPQFKNFYCFRTGCRHSVLNIYEDNFIQSVNVYLLNTHTHNMHTSIKFYGTYMK